MSGDYIARILDPKVPFEGRFRQVAGLGHDAEHAADGDEGHDARLAEPGCRDAADDSGGDHRPAEPRPGLVWADPWRELRAADAAPGNVGPGVRGDYQR